jgi:hypothetical protein
MDSSVEADALAKHALRNTPVIEGGRSVEIFLTRHSYEWAVRAFHVNVMDASVCEVLGSLDLTLLGFGLP